MRLIRCTSLPDSSCLVSSKNLSLGFNWTKTLMMGRMIHFPVGRMDHFPGAMAEPRPGALRVADAEKTPPVATSWPHSIVWPPRDTTLWRMSSTSAMN